jgi:hypothetical protein
MDRLRERSGGQSKASAARDLRGNGPAVAGSGCRRIDEAETPGGGTPSTTPETAETGVLPGTINCINWGQRASRCMTMDST